MKFRWYLVIGYVILCNIVPGDDVTEEPMVDMVEEPIIEETPIDDSVYMSRIDYCGGDGKTIKLATNPESIDPTYEQAIEFIRADRTDRNDYIPNQYICGDFAADVQYNAEVAGYQCAWVYIEFKDGPSHACNAFNTTDRGLVFIDCTRGMGDGPTNQDCIVHVANGEEYTQQFIKSADYEPLPMGVVENHEIIWDGGWW